MDAASAVVLAPKEGGGGGYRGLDAWQISFEQALAMRYGPIHNWSGAVHAPRPEDFEVGTWEVDPSSWLAQITPAGYSGRVHHSVLTYNDAIYEIAAASCRAEPLPEGWELPEEMRRGPRHYPWTAARAISRYLRQPPELSARTSRCAQNRERQ